MVGRVWGGRPEAGLRVLTRRCPSAMGKACAPDRRSRASPARGAVISPRPRSAFIRSSTPCGKGGEIAALSV